MIVVAGAMVVAEVVVDVVVAAVGVVIPAAVVVVVRVVVLPGRGAVVSAISNGFVVIGAGCFELVLEMTGPYGSARGEVVLQVVVVDLGVVAVSSGESSAKGLCCRSPRTATRIQSSEIAGCMFSSWFLLVFCVKRD